MNGEKKDERGREMMNGKSKDEQEEEG